MNFVYPNLIREMKAKHLTAGSLAPHLGLSKSAICRRLRGETDWKLPEVVKLCQFFENLDASELFVRLDTKS